MVKVKDEANVDWGSCPARGCHNHFDQTPNRFVISGDGEWKHTITCLECFHVRERVPIETLVELLADQWGLRISQVELILG